MRTSLTAVLVLLAAACSRTPEPTGSAPPEAKTQGSSAAAPAAPAPATPSAGAKEITWTDPAGWQKVPPSSPMRKATYRVPAAPKDSEDGEMAVFYFKGEGGGTEPNIQRWIGQFPDAKSSDVQRTSRTSRGMSQTIVEVEGTYSSGMPGGSATPKSGYRLIGAVVETPAGPYFFKLTGPKKTVEGARNEFLKMLDSITPG